VALGNLYCYQDAAESFDRATEINPGFKEALYGKYLALQHIKCGDELITITEKITAMKDAMAPLAIPTSGSSSGSFPVPVRDDFAAYFLKTGSEHYKKGRLEDAAYYYKEQRP